MAPSFLPASLPAFLCISASAFALTPLQQFYLPYYLRTEVAGVMHKTDKYQLLVVADARGRLHLAGDNELQAGRTIIPGGKPLAVELTPAARAAGAEILYRTRPLSIATGRCTNT
jgi:hypothetical protein